MASRASRLFAFQAQWFQWSLLQKTICSRATPIHSLRAAIVPWSLGRMACTVWPAKTCPCIPAAIIEGFSQWEQSPSFAPSVLRSFHFHENWQAKVTKVSLKNDTEWIQNGYRMDTEWIQNGYRMDTEWIQNGYRMDENSLVPFG